MTNREASNWLINVTADIGKVEHQDLWHYEQALLEIREMLESAPEPCKDAVSREAVLSDLKRWIGYLDEDMIERMGIGMKKLPSVQPEQRYTEEELSVFAHGISLSLLSKRSAQHWRYDKDTATEIEFLERLYEKVRADMRGEQDG